MDLQLGRQVVIVTGAASGIGAAAARLLAAEGAGGLVLTDRDAPGLARLAADLTPATPVETVVSDLADPAASAAIAAAAIARFGRIDGLVNAAGLTTRGSFETGTAAIWDELFDVNARAGFLLMQAAIVDMRRRGAPGAIVNILSMNAYCGLPELAIYSATKGAMATLTRNAAHAHMADRIRVTGINLGWVATETELLKHADMGHGPDWMAAAAAAQPLGRLVTAEECARLTAFLLSDASVPMTGAILDLEQKVAGAI
ncbi:oxidoreductase [Tabrizicola sp.]|uniref:oxidoreductase n=1 Tax=Tabrizicola sp. TaxID=2005166 RepID=UPI001A37EA68|nr:oxidoreductase [Tabrizicola sp.]MBL9072925.1 SDR family oxidoreductase [Tabrizicola sp.]